MTIPISTPQIGATGVLQQPGVGEIINHALLQWQDLAQKRTELKRKQEEFELHKKIMGTQLEGTELDNEKKKRAFKAEDADLAARREALTHFMGSLPHLDDPKAIGEEIANVSDPAVAAHYYALITEAQQVRHAAMPNYQFQDTLGPDGKPAVMALDPENPTQPVGTGLRPIPPAPPQPSVRIPAVTEREKASAAVGAAQANAVVNRLETADPTIAARVARRVAAYKAGISAVGKRLLGVSPDEIKVAAESQIEQSMAPDELEFYQASKQWLAAVVPGLAGKQMTATEFMVQAPPYFSMGATTPQVAANRRKARATRTKGFMAEAGDAMTERMAEIAQPEEYGLGTVLLPDSTQRVITPGRARFSPKFMR